MYLKTKKMTDISQTQAGFKAKSRRNPLWIPRRFNAKSRCVCRNRLNFRLFRYTLVLSETSKSSSVSVNAAGFCACERSSTFVALRCTSGAGADRNRQGGPGNQGRGRGDKKANGISAANPHPVVKGERRPVGGRAIHQTHTRRRKHRKPFAGARCTHRAAKKREPCAANLPSLPQGAHPAARPRRKQGHAKQIIAQKQENATKKANFTAKLRSVCAEDHKRAVKVYKRDRCQKENQE